MRRSFLRSIAFVTLFAVCTTSFAEVPEIEKVHIQGTTLHIEGPITSQTYNLLAYMVRELSPVEKVSVNSYGGSSDAAWLLAEKIEDYGWATELVAGNKCASACMIVFRVIPAERAEAYGIIDQMSGTEAASL